jgi:arsenate reductase
MKARMATINGKLAKYVEKVLARMAAIPDERKRQLDALARFVSERRDADEAARLTFICTHNSRRSHLAQLWAATAAAYYGVEGIATFSGGTEATAFNPRAVAALERAGFSVENPGGDNPHYQIRYASDGPAMECFSKKYDDAPNPSEGFAAVMTCSDADESCPVVRGASFRIPIRYEDPKIADATPGETAKYDERCFQIATEMFYVLSRVERTTGYSA